METFKQNYSINFDKFKRSPKEIVYVIFQVSLSTSLYELSRVLDRDYFALVVHSQKLCKYQMFFAFIDLLERSHFFISRSAFKKHS